MPMGVYIILSSNFLFSTYYNAPPKFHKVVESFYTGLYASVSSGIWDTSFIPIQVGVYQGDPLSVVIFNTVINTMVDMHFTIQTRLRIHHLPISETSECIAAC